MVFQKASLKQGKLTFSLVIKLLTTKLRRFIAMKVILKILKNMEEELLFFKNFIQVGRSRKQI